jgi:hypothetical protein
MAKSNDGDICESKRASALDSTVARKNGTTVIYDYWTNEAKFLDARRYFIDLFF